MICKRAIAEVPQSNGPARESEKWGEEEEGHRKKRMRRRRGTQRKEDKKTKREKKRGRRRRRMRRIGKERAEKMREREGK